MIENKPKWRVQGTIEGEIPVLLQLFHDKYDPQNLSAELTLLSQGKFIESSFRNTLRGDDYGTLKISSNDDSPTIILRGIQGYSHQGKNAKLKIQAYEYGISDDVIINAEDIFVSVELTPSGILKKWGIKEINYDGSIKHDDSYPEDVEWEFELGKAKAFSKYAYEEHVVYDNKATIQIERPALHFSINNANNTLTTKLIQEKIQKEVRDICYILSLCYRKMVRWYQIEITTIYKEKTNIIPKMSGVRRMVYRENYPERLDELINHRTLINDGLQDLLNNYRGSNQIDALQRCITFLSSSMASHTVEVNYFFSIIALEAFCDAFIERNSKNVKIPSAKWKIIEKALRNALKELSADKNLEAHVKTVTSKLPELKGITTSDKIVFCCNTLNAKVDDLWRKDGFESGLKKALSLRNQLFHRAYFEDPFLLYSNRLRLQIIAERLLLKHLNWPDEKIWRWHDQELRWAIINE
jgi:hypothetical protein